MYLKDYTVLKNFFSSKSEMNWMTFLQNIHRFNMKTSVRNESNPNWELTKQQRKIVEGNANKGLKYDNSLYRKLLKTLNSYGKDNLDFSDNEYIEISKTVYSTYHVKTLKSLIKFMNEFRSTILQDMKVLDQNKVYAPKVAEEEEFIKKLIFTGLYYFNDSFASCIYDHKVLIKPERQKFFKLMYNREPSQADDTKLKNYFMLYNIYLQRKTSEFISTVLLNTRATIMNRLVTNRNSILTDQTRRYCWIHDLATFATIDQTLSINSHKIDLEYISDLNLNDDLKKKIKSVLREFIFHQAGIKQTAEQLENVLAETTSYQFYLDKKQLLTELQNYLKLLQPENGTSIAVAPKYNATNYTSLTITSTKNWSANHIIHSLSGKICKITQDEDNYFTKNNLDFSIFHKSSGETYLWFGTGSFVNHSCNPNAKLHTKINGELCIQSLRDIKLYEEITWNYGNEFFEKGECVCTTCKGVTSDESINSSESSCPSNIDMDMNDISF